MFFFRRGLLALASLQALALPIYGAPLLVYPTGGTSANPRIPCIPPEPHGSGGGYAMEVEALFQYPLTPLISFDDGGAVEAEIRDNSQRKEYELLSLTEGDSTLSLLITRIGEGKVPKLVYRQGGKVRTEQALTTHLAPDWQHMKLIWKGQTAQLTIATGESISLALPRPFAPTSVSLQIRAVDELKIEGQGAFVLDWEKDYAARVTPPENASTVTASLLGFDTYVISRDAEKRDFPMLQILNSTNEERRFSVQFALHGEVSGTSKEWTQEISLPARSGLNTPVAFPELLPSDVYHLNVRSEELFPGQGVMKHFLFAQPLPGQSVIPKFGLHDSDRRVFGFWPDTLPIHLFHVYSRWAYVYGPAWETQNALSPETPVEELNWNPFIDWGIKQGLTPFVSLISIPDTSWMREKEYDATKMKVYAWGKIGGAPDLKLYGEFLKALVTRYKGKVSMYEIENEPMAYLGGKPPEDYARLSKVAAEAIHSVDAEARVFGISGTGHFVPWMREVFKLDGAAGLNGVSIHTYVTPRFPEAALLPEKLNEIHEVMASINRPLALLNSETGTFVALREVVDRPISPSRLQELIQQGVSPFFVKAGWPNYAVDEHTGAISIVRNAIYNFLARTEYFTFFGWNGDWPKPDWWGAPAESCFAMISSTPKNERCPSHYTLAIAVLTQQLRSAEHMKGRAINEGGIAGAIFPTAEGGEVAVIWSPQGKRNVLGENVHASIEATSLLGQKTLLPPTGKNGLVRLEVGPEPLYLHTAKAGLHFLPSPVIGVSSDHSGGLKFTLINRYPQDWSGKVTFASSEGWSISPTDSSFEIKQGGRTTIQATCQIPTSTPRGSHNVEATISLPDGTPFAFPIPVAVRPTLLVSRVSDDFNWSSPDQWKSLPTLSIDQPDQVVVGQPPLLSSLQEERFWKGSTELSAQARFASDGKTLFIYLDVTDANYRAPEKWPGVLGSCVEVFLDQRPANALGQSAYSKGVSQLLIRPATSSEGPTTFQTTEKFGMLKGIQTAGSPCKDGKYWVALAIPLRSDTATFSLDVGINGPPKDGEGRKSQLMLFGTSTNNTDASGFGIATIAEKK